MAYGYGTPGAFVATVPPSAQAGMIPSLTLPKQILRVSQGALWSTWDYGVTATPFGTEKGFFQIAVGQAGQGFARPTTFPETNMNEAGRIPNGYGFMVDALAYQPYACVPASVAALNWATCSADLLNLMHQTAFRWNLFGTTIDISPGICIGAGGGVYGATADTGNAYGGGFGSAVALNNGAGQVWIYKNEPIQLPAGQTFSILQIPSTDVAPVNVDAVANVVLRGRLLMFGRFAQAVATG
jgi:hypothetical protein